MEASLAQPKALWTLRFSLHRKFTGSNERTFINSAIPERKLFSKAHKKHLKEEPRKIIFDLFAAIWISVLLFSLSGFSPFVWMGEKAFALIFATLKIPMQINYEISYNAELNFSRDSFVACSRLEVSNIFQWAGADFRGRRRTCEVV